jgi:acetyl-CoA C-acetyltransferase
MSAKQVVVAGAVRTPIGRFGGGLVKLSAADLGTAAAVEAMKRAGVAPEVIDETLFGHGRQAGGGTNTARQVSIRAGVPNTAPAMTINKACASSIKTIAQAFDMIQLGRDRAALVGGTESMSNTPYMLTNARFGYRLGHSEVVDGMYRDGFQCPIANVLMGVTAENLAEKYAISRDEQDAYAERTQQRCGAATEKGLWKDETFPIEIPGRKGPTIVDTDEHPRPTSTAEGMKKLKAVFKKDGTVHAGNSSGITDGAAAMVVLEADRAEELGVEPMARVVDWTAAGVAPEIMGIGPVPAVHQLLERQNMKLDDIDVIELNEAFAAQVIACDRELKLDMERVNVNGGSIALGHPIGATGSRICVTLLHEMKRRQARYGMATLCVSGGMGMAILFERV